MIDLKMTEIFNFSRIEEKNEFQKFEIQKNLIKDKITGRVLYNPAQLEKNAKKLKLRSQGPKKVFLF